MQTRKQYSGTFDFVDIFTGFSPAHRRLLQGRLKTPTLIKAPMKFHSRYSWLKDFENPMRVLSGLFEHNRYYRAYAVFSKSTLNRYAFFTGKLVISF